MAPLCIVFMGTPQFACPTLQMLIDRGERVVAVVTQPDRPKGRGQQTQAPPVKELAVQHGIPVLQPLKVRSPEAIEEIRSLAPDLIVVVAFGQILPKALLEIPRYGCINVHASLLPRYRGAAPINWAIINGENEAGVTTMQMDVGLDTGDMLLKRSTTIAPDDDAQSLHDRLSIIGAEAMAETLDLLAAGKLVPEKQDDSLSNYAPMLKKEDGRIDWRQESRAIVSRISGVTPWPGAYTFLDGKLLKLFRARTGTGSGVPGTILAADRSGLEVACSGGSIIIGELQLEGKRRLSVGDFLAGCRLLPGTVLEAKDI
ncbi:methionyl-tRNA formyltransferase [Geobacter argillaceus]|uniref:Methionyl-tRNA formyltransferase n=1 Tax=Geobacter argillaceus TaxID=345631 RepID=A0A562WSP4_9BACT|nr:methionyl-tRNA formyltransferase [Geobacter argillaceus]TWJ32454.1 methionyl-tRNA formyltransferase [Geobacter argillaceus]